MLGIRRCKHGKVRPVKGLVKTRTYQVRVSARDAEALEKAVRAERERRQDSTIGGATLLRELAMPKVREILANTQVAA